MSAEALTVNARIWENLYRRNAGDLSYPNDVLVRLGTRLFGKGSGRRMLDFGCGTGANLLHFVRQGFKVCGVEVSPRAISRTEERLRAAGLAADMRLIEPGAALPFENAFFDVVYAWQVIYYNDGEGWMSTVRELERVTAMGGSVLIATAAPGDISHVQSEPLDGHTYRSRAAGQEGCIITIPDAQALPRFFPNQELDIGEFGFSFGKMNARHWIISYKKSTI